MRSFFILLLGLVLANAAVAQSSPAEATRDAAPAELDALFALTTSRPPEGTAGAAQYWWFDGLTRKIGDAAFAFIEKHPDDPRRWRAALILQQRRFHPRFVVSIADDYATAGEKAVKRDTAAEAAWDARGDGRARGGPRTT
jgi:hypothetical protein